jgi:hypothetical protein
MTFRIQFGCRVDEYLAAEGAVAQAVDQGTVLLSSSVLRMSANERQLILLHELAHMRQLANTGNDPTHALEEEAWDAAHAWRAGMAYRVRGRARRPLNAVAIIQGGKRGHPAAPAWYSSNPIEPIGTNSSITVKKVVIQADMAIESIMDSIIEEKAKDVVIVCHGIASGLLIPFIVGSKFFAVHEPIIKLASDHARTVAGINLPVYADNAVANQLPEVDVKRLRVKMNQVRDLKLEHVAFRACDMGQSPDATMASFKELFGPKSISAPKLLDTYGTFKTEIKGGVDAWVKGKREKEKFRVWIDRGVAFGIKLWAKDTSQFQIICRAPNRETFSAWVRAHIADLPGSNNEVVFHGMMEKMESVADPNAPIQYFVRDDAFIANIINIAG